MIPVSTDYRQELIKGNRNWVIKIPVSLAGNTSGTPDFTLTNEHIWDNGIVLDEAISSDSSFDIGAAIVGSLKVVIDNIHGDFSQYDFYGARLTLWLGVEGDEDDGDQRYYRIGFYVVDVPNYNGSLITLNCLDNMTWFDTDFDTSWVNWASSSTTTRSVLRTICQHVGVSLANQYFPYYDTVLTGLKPEQKLTCREVMQYIAQLCCCYCKIDTAGQLVLKWYDKSAISGMIDYDGGTFSTTTTPYSDGDAVDGMLFNPWLQGTQFDGGTFDALHDRAFISQNYEIEVSTDDVFITGCRVRNNTSKDKAYDVYWADSSVEADHDRYLLVIENNPFITLDTIATSYTKASVIANRVGNILAGLQMRGFSATSVADFSYETGDLATVIDFRGNRYYTWITHFTFTTNNSERFNCGVQSVKQRSEQRFSTLAETIEQARSVVTAYDNAVRELNTLGQAAIGYSEYFYPTTGSNRVMYRYNLGTVDATDPANPKFPNATVVFKITGDGVFVAQKNLGGIAPDGTCTFTNGYDANSGTAILNLLYVRGLNADWINAGQIDADRLTANVITSINNATGTTTISGGKINIAGVVSGINAGSTTIDGGKISTNTITANQIQAGAVDTDELAANAITSGKIKAGEVKATNIATDAVEAGKIKAGAVTTAKLDTGAVTADKISVDNLAAIKADLGNITAGSISSVSIDGCTITSENSGKKLKIAGSDVELFGNSGAGYVRIFEGNKTASFYPYEFGISSHYSHAAWNNGSTYLQTSSHNIIEVADSYSDERLKIDIEPIDDEVAKELILNAELKQFKRTYQPDKLRFGVIAQNVREQIDKVGLDKEHIKLTNEDDEGYFEIDYREYIPMLMRIVQLQQKEIDELKARIK